MKKVIYLILFILLVGLLSACNEDEDAQLNEPSTIFTTIYPLEYAISEISGDFLDVESIYPNEVDAHHYEPSSKQITQIASGDAFIYLGATMETSAEKIDSALKNQAIELVNISETIDIFDEHDGQLDPHVWLDPERMIKIGETITTQLTTMYPEHTDDFKGNFKTFSDKMKDLDQSFKNTLDSAHYKKMLAIHPAYGYWEDKYGIEQIKVARIGEEPSQKDLAQIVKLAKTNHITAVVFESNHQSKLGEMLIDELNAKKVEIHTLETRTNQEVENNEDYYSIMLDNLEVLREITQ